MSRKQWLTLSVVILTFIGINVLFLYISPREVTAAVGIDNSYLVTFAAAALGGLSSFTSGVYYTLLATFASGGSLPWLLGIAGGLGLSIGDSIIFFLARYGSQSLSQRWQARMHRAAALLARYPRWVTYAALYLYLGFSPLPNDILMIALAFLHFEYKKILPFIILGGITISTITAYLGGQWLDWFRGI